MRERESRPQIRFEGFEAEWENVTIRELFHYKRPDKYISTHNVFFEQGKTPVLTANKAFILGYTNEKNICNDECILFDDFTQEIKYVDFPFLVRSSALKFLLSKCDFDIKFLYFLLKSVNFESYGHARHYITYVKNKSILIPKLKESNRILSFFNSIDNQINTQNQKIEKLENIKKELLQKMFADKDNLVPKIRFEGFEGEWIKNNVGALFTIKRGLVLDQKSISKFKYGNYIYPVYSSQTLNDGLLGYYKNYLFHNCITWTTDGANAGTVSFRKNNFFATNVCGVLDKKEYEPNLFFANVFKKETFQHVIYEVGNPKLMSHVVKDIEIFFTNNLQEQQKIAKLFSTLDNVIKLNKQKLEKLQNIKTTLLQKMFV